ncbi:hypothetical protein OIU34_00600 [Pararhizobium sp. BT-229]|uniref:hypothetical protein n=1 Tax=Pararhizobium sp. BT-229 TaxID=2986923 RepID=UPI0021F6CAD0|nr:hypothetical protein [Pararhizobium sp. BT-229]MCV9960385.1 hypothetical protein [Pararhizobium sp. BT-229]
MSTTEQAVRDAAAKFHEAITDARKAGFAVTWPMTVDGLLSISISETKRAALPAVDPNVVDDPASRKAKPKV